MKRLQALVHYRGRDYSGFLGDCRIFVEIINKTLSLLDQIYLRKQLLFHLMVSDNLLSCLHIQRRKRNLLYKYAYQNNIKVSCATCIYKY